MPTNRSLELARRVKTGNVVFVSSWTVEKLYKVAEAVAQARESQAVRLYGETALKDELYEAYRNICKLAAWMADNTQAYREETAESSYADPEWMLRHVEELLAPLLDEGSH